METTSTDDRTVKLLLTPEEAAAALGIKRAKLYQLIMAREIFSVKIGASRRFPLNALEEYVERLCDMQRIGYRGTVGRGMGAVEAKAVDSGEAWQR